MFADETQTNLGERKYYTIGRQFQNPLARYNDQSSLKSHVQKQKYILWWDAKGNSSLIHIHLFII